MLWWFVGVWLASGAVVPVLLLLRAAWRGIFPREIEAAQQGKCGVHHPIRIRDPPARLAACRMGVQAARARSR